MSRVVIFAEDDTPIAILRGEANLRGGAEKQLAMLLSGLSRAGHDVTLIHTDRGMPSNHDGIHVVPVGLRWQTINNLRGLWSALDAAQPDVIYSRMPSDFTPALAAYARQHRPTEFFFGLANDVFANPWTAYSYRPIVHGSFHAATLFGADRILVQHDDQVGLLPKSVRAKTVPMRNILRSSNLPFRSFENADTDMIWVAQLRPEKQVDRFLDLAAHHETMQCLIVGGVPADLPPVERDRVLGRISELDNVTHEGLLSPSDVLAAVGRSRVLVNTSRNEGFPNTMLEAWDLGVPVLSLTVDPGGVIEREELGLVSRTPKRLAEDANRLVLDRTLNLRCGSNGAAYVESTHSEDAVIAAFDQLIRRPVGV